MRNTPYLLCQYNNKYFVIAVLYNINNNDLLYIEIETTNSNISRITFNFKYVINNYEKYSVFTTDRTHIGISNINDDDVVLFKLLNYDDSYSNNEL